MMAARNSRKPKIQLKRVYDPPAATDGFRILVDRLWPRGLSKAAAGIDLWAKDVAPSTELRKWFDHDPDRWPAFQSRYKAELRQRKDELAALRDRCAEGRVTLLFGAKDLEHNQAIVLKAVLERGLVGKKRG
jgi:uncharacterized protein YeaO (DUF488 family)